MSSCAKPLYVDGIGNVIVSDPSPLETCQHFMLMSPSEYLSYKNIFAFDSDGFSLGVLGVISLFVVGFGAGVVMGLVRKVR